MIEQLERDKEALLDHYAAIALEALDSLMPEEHHQPYEILRLQVSVRSDANPEVGGVFGEDLLVSNLVSVPGIGKTPKAFSGGALGDSSRSGPLTK
jgi:hypothetical protein